jgi:hypothetical protein
MKKTIVGPVVLLQMFQVWQTRASGAFANVCFSESKIVAGAPLDYPV